MFRPKRIHLFLATFAASLLCMYLWSSVLRCKGGVPSSETAVPATNETSLLPRKDVLIRSVYYDNRPRDGHSTAFIFIVALKKIILDKGWIVGCGVGSHVALSYRIRIPGETRDMHIHEGPNRFPYEEVMVECFDIPAVVTDERSAFIKYRTSSNLDAEIHLAGSERPVKVPSPYIPPPNGSEYNFTVLVCTKAHNKAVPWLKEFLRYQKTLGVDHVHVNAEATFIKEGGYKTLLEDGFSRKALKEGYMSLDVFKDWYQADEIYSHSVTLMYLDCVYRFRGTYDYVFVLDSDDFFNPVLENHQIHFYVKNYCHENSIGSCRFKWVLYYPDCGIKSGPIEDGNVTSRLKSSKADVLIYTKSIHRSSALLDATFHYAAALMPGYRTVYIPMDVAYVAHVRHRWKLIC